MGGGREMLGREGVGTYGNHSSYAFTSLASKQQNTTLSNPELASVSSCSSKNRLTSLVATSAASPLG